MKISKKTLEMRIKKERLMEINKKPFVLCILLIAFVFFIKCTEKVPDHSFIEGHWGLISLNGVDYENLDYTNNSFYFNKNNVVSLPYKNYFDREREALWYVNKNKSDSLSITINSNKDDKMSGNFNIIWLDKEKYIIRLNSNQNVIVLQKINTFNF